MSVTLWLVDLIRCLVPTRLPQFVMCSDLSTTMAAVHRRGRRDFSIPSEARVREITDHLRRLPSETNIWPDERGTVQTRVWGGGGRETLFTSRKGRDGTQRTYRLRSHPDAGHVLQVLTPGKPRMLTRYKDLTSTETSAVKALNSLPLDGPGSGKQLKQVADSMSKMHSKWMELEQGSTVKAHDDNK